MTFHGIREAVELETPGTEKDAKAELKELFTGGPGQNFRRVCLGVVVQCFQQVRGMVFCIFHAY